MVKDFFTYGHGKGMSYCFGVSKARAQELYESAQFMFNSLVAEWRIEGTINTQGAQLDLGKVMHSILQQAITEQEEALVLFALGGFVQNLKNSQHIKTL